MLNVTKIYARSFDLDHIDVFWEIGNFEGNIRQYTFQIFRSESSSGPWDALSPEFEDIYYFRDTTPPRMHKWRSFYYLLKIRDKQTSEVATFGPTSQQAEPDLIALEINRQEDILFREFVGRRCWVFQVRTFGPYCVCYNKISGRKEKSNCLNCFDTGYLGGYMSPISCFIQFDPSGMQPTPTPFRERQDNKSSARLISFPPIKPKDIIIEAENVRWKVESVTPTQRLRSVVHQELVIRQVDMGEIEYKLPINISDIKNIEISAKRNFTNPQHVDEPSDIKNILAVYGYQPRGVTR